MKNECDICIKELNELSLNMLRCIACGYVSNEKFTVKKRETDREFSFYFLCISLDTPYEKQFIYDTDDIQRYNQILKQGFSYAAYVNHKLAGIIIAEPQYWNKSILIWEFHVKKSLQKIGVGRMLMAACESKACENGFRILVCETQNINVSAIRVYRKLGFCAEAVDISLYSNTDYPDGEIAVFMKKRI